MSDLYKRLLEYSSSDYYPFHMPGHKRNIEQGVNPYAYDITEIDGFDNLHDPQGILRIAMEEASKFYHSDKTYFLINGSTCGILSAICGCTRKGDKIAVARNCHKSVYNAMFLQELTPVYIYPDYIDEFGICGGIDPIDVKEILNNNDIKAVVITSPTYEGIVSDIKEIANIVHKFNIPLIVDEAHGAHFGMSDGLPQSALSQGADIVIQSLHKTLPALTQTALLHVNSNIVKYENIEKYLHIYQTSSPSYVLMSSIDECINKVRSDRLMMFDPYIKRLSVIMSHSKKLTHIKVMGQEIVGENSVFQLDPSKLIISVKGTSMTGRELYDTLNDRFHLQMEMMAKDYVIAMTSPMDTEEGLLRLFTAIAEIDRDIRIYGGFVKDTMFEYIQPEAIVVNSISKAYDMPGEVVELCESAGRISEEFVYLYPPGIPIIAPGELITKECIILIEQYRESGLEIHGTKYKNAEKIIVQKENFKSLSFTNLV